MQPRIIAHVKNVYGNGKKERKKKIQKQFGINIIKNTRNLFRLKKENEAVSDRIVRNIMNLF